ncbi:hypothetical protein IKG33_02190 [Candidatus Saccharibacteria bacterium]|nr:hypothetical protein [Candidatus Saccharibacteria bacterium]
MDDVYNYWLGVVVIAVVGTLAHFIYDWSGKNKIIGLFTAVNESTWEHIKIALTPTILWSLYDGFIYGFNPNYFCAKLMSLIVLVFFIPLVFYSYQKISHKPIFMIDIATFFIAIILSQLTFYVIINLAPMWPIFQYLSCILTFVFFGCYMTLTLEPLKNLIFKDPLTGKYGFRGHSDIFKLRKNKTQGKKSKE